MDRRGSQVGAGTQFNNVSRPVIGRLNGFFRRFFDENPGLRGGRRIHSIIFDDRGDAQIDTPRCSNPSTPSTSQSVSITSQQSDISADRRRVIQLSSFYNNKEAFHDGFNIIGCHGSTNETPAHLHWIHMCPDPVSCTCTPKVRAESFGFSVKSRIYGNNNAAEQHFSSAVAYLCKFQRRILRFTNAGRDIALPQGLEDGIKTLSTWYEQHPESHVAGEMEICSLSRAESTQSSHENIFGRKRPNAAAASDWKRHNSSDNYLPPAEANKLAENIDAIILKHFPRHVHELNGLDDFKELTKDIFIPFGAKLVQIVDRCWLRIATEWQKNTLNQIIAIRKKSFFDKEKFYTLNTSLQLVKHLLQEQFDNDGESCKEFISRICNIVDKEEAKRNTICIEGDSNAESKPMTVFKILTETGRRASNGFVYVDVIVNGITYNAFIDFGSQLTVIDDSLLDGSESLGSILFDIDSFKADYYATTNKIFSVYGKEKKYEVVVAKNYKELILLSINIFADADLCVHARTGRIFKANDKKSFVHAKENVEIPPKQIRMIESFVSKDARRFDSLMVHTPDNMYAKNKIAVNNAIINGNPNKIKVINGSNSVRMIKKGQVLAAVEQIDPVNIKGINNETFKSSKYTPVSIEELAPPHEKYTDISKREIVKSVEFANHKINVGKDLTEQQRNHVTIGCYPEGDSECIDDNVRIWKNHDTFIDGKRIVFDKIKKCLSRLATVEYVPSSTRIVEEIISPPIVQIVSSTTRSTSSMKEFVMSTTSRPERVFYKTTQRIDIASTVESKRVPYVSTSRPIIQTTGKPKYDVWLFTAKPNDVTFSTTIKSLYDFDKNGFRKLSNKHIDMKNENIPSTTSSTRINSSENKIEFEFTKDLVNKYNSLKATISTSSSVMVIFVIVTTIGNITIIGIVCCGLRRRSRRETIRVNESGNLVCSCASDSYFDDGCFNKACPMRISNKDKKVIEENIEMKELNYRSETNDEMKNYDQKQLSTSIYVEPASTFPKTIFNGNNPFITTVSFHNNDNVIIHDTVNESNETHVSLQMDEFEPELVLTAIEKVNSDNSSEMEQPDFPSLNQIETVEPPLSLLNRDHESFHDSSDESMAADELSEILSQIQHVAEVHMNESHCIYNNQSTPIKNVEFKGELVVPQKELIEIPLNDIEELPVLNVPESSNEPKQDQGRRKTKWNLRPRIFTPKRFQSGK
ncbi:hypothetical protein BLOT_009323 [Blomia tropicalis]|nr:hypothetical protein BLOT_009323 [Blomia tropicalis]